MTLRKKIVASRPKMIFLLPAIIWSSCNYQSGKTKHSQVSASENEYPRVIDSAKLQDAYDEGRWLLYCLYCDWHCVFADKFNIKDTSIDYGTLNLRFDKLICRSNSDTVEIIYTFFYKDSIPCGNSTKGWLAEGFGCLRDKDSIIYMVYPGWRFYMDFLKQSKAHNRLVKPLQPEVIKYIKKNKDKIDPWFRKEAEKRGVLSGADSMSE